MAFAERTNRSGEGQRDCNHVARSSRETASDRRQAMFAKMDRIVLGSPTLTKLAPPSVPVIPSRGYVAVGWRIRLRTPYAKIQPIDLTCHVAARLPLYVSPSLSSHRLCPAH